MNCFSKEIVVFDFYGMCENYKAKNIQETHFTVQNELVQKYILIKIYTITKIQRFKDFFLSCQKLFGVLCRFLKDNLYCH